MKMKKKKRILTLLLSSAMALTMGMTAFAAEYSGVRQSTSASSDTGGSESGSSQTAQQKCTITAPDNGHTYEIYQIFTARYEEDGDTKKVSDVKWGVNGIGETGTTVDETVLKALQDVNGKSEDERREEITKYVTLSNPVATLSNGSLSYTDGLAGYYLIKDKDNTLDDGRNATPYIVQAVGNLVITPKTGDTTFEKKLKDTNDSTGETTNWQDSADYDIGDQIPFKLEGTVAENYAAYESYYFAFHDQEETGLTFDSSTVEVYVNNNGTDTKIDSGYRVVTDSASMAEVAGAVKCSFEIIFDDLKSIEAVQAGSKIRVEYKSTLNDKAALGAEGNVNKAKLEYSSNPSDTQHGNTPWDSVIVFTYKVVVNKYADEVDDAGNNKLSGAEFTLEKHIYDGTQDGKWEFLTLVKSDDGKSFSFSGLDDGEYRLTETKAPQYYNSLTAPLTFKVEAGHNTEWDGAKTALPNGYTYAWDNQNRQELLSSLTGTKETGEIEFAFTSDKMNGSLTTNVINKSGTTLPETGGIGTTIFYIVGGVLVVGAAVMLITKKRIKSSDKDR